MEKQSANQKVINSLKHGGVITLAILLFVILAVLIISYSIYSFNINLWKM